MAKFKLRYIPGWNYFEYLLVRGLTGFLNSLPIERATALIRALAGFAFLFPSRKKKTALQNIDRVFDDSLTPEAKKKLAKAAYENFALSLMEFFRIEPMLKEAKDRFEFEGTEFLDRAFARGKGIICPISHLGSWEYLSFLPYLRGYSSAVVVRDIKNPHLDQWIRGLREKTKLKPINRQGSIRKILTELKNNSLVAILIDQWAGPDGLWLDFFSKPTSTTSVPVRLSQKTQAPLLPMYCIRTGVGQYKIKIFPDILVPPGPKWETETTLLLNKLLEQEILKTPEQWIWSHRRWKDYSRYRSGGTAEPITPTPGGT